MNVGDTVRIVKCSVCPNGVDKTAKVTKVVENGVEVSFGRGRPQAGRPKCFQMDEVAVVDIEQGES